MKTQKLDIILCSRSAEAAKSCVKFLAEEKAYKEGSLTLYVLDMNGDQKDSDVFQDISKDHLVYIDTHDKNEPEAFNIALSQADGEYITFMADDSCVYTPNALKSVIKELEKNKIVSLTPVCFREEQMIEYSALNASYDKKGRIKVDLNLFPEKFHLCFSAYFFQRKALGDLLFDERMIYDSECKMLIDVLDKHKKYVMLESKCTYTTADENDYFNYQPQFDKEWYQDTMKYFLIDGVKEGDSRFRQRAVLYLIENRYACNMNERDKTVLSPEEVKEFIDNTGKALEHIEDVIICDNMLNGKARIPKYFTLNLLRMKYQDENLMPEIVSSAKNLTAYYKDSLIWSLAGSKVEIKSMYFDGKQLLIDGFFLGSYAIREEELQIVALINGTKIYDVRKNGIYALNKFFNLSAKRDYSFQLMMPEEILEDGMQISIAIRYEGRYYPIGLSFNRAQTKISTWGPSYWVFGQHIISYKNKGSYLLIEDLTKANHKAHEKALIKGIARSTHGSWKIKMVGNRCLYWITKPFYKNKKIWLTMDKLFKAGDNGEYFYRYVKKMNPKGIKIYYVVQKNSPDYKRLKKEYNTIVKFNSIRHKMLALHTDLMLATHVDTLNCNGYYKATQKYFKDLYNARVVCLAHGLTIQKIAQYQNRVFDNTVLYFFASKYEVENVSQDIYDYYDKDMLKLTGHARYDGLISNDQKIILITPTWRRGITSGSAKKGSTYAHSDSFRHSEYYKIYNGLISDKRLIETAKRTGYRIVYLLHPAMSNQLEDFDKQEGVDIVAATSDISYEKILTESSLMVTDYSGVQFDFAYMKKPLVYYHPDTLPPQYEAGGLVYETMGFGPICKNHQQMIDTLCEYMENNCQMQEMYKERVNDFFKYSDHDNCSRIYEEVISFQENFGKVNEFTYK